MAPQRKPLIAGNWKMNLNHLEAIALTQKIAFSLKEEHLTAVEVVVLPPFVDLRSVQTLVGAAMLAKLGCSYVVVGHSERREHHSEDDALVNAKVKAAYRHEIVPILCIGETLDVRESDGHVAHCVSQLDGALAGVTAEQAASIVIAYEPVWAIGTGKVATPADAQEVCAAIREQLSVRYTSELAAGVRILYGGSVKASNAAEIVAQPDVDGALVGGASLDGPEFATIVLAARPGRTT